MPQALGCARAKSAPLPREADIVVIGAGAAGIAAARRIMAANRKVIVERRSPGQIGGRCNDGCRATFEVRRSIARALARAQSRYQRPRDQAGAALYRARRRTGDPEARKFASAVATREPGRNRAVLGKPWSAPTAAHRWRLARQEADVPPRLATAERSRRLGRDGGIRARRQCHRQGFEGYFHDRQGAWPGPHRCDRLSPGPGHADDAARRQFAAGAVDAGKPHRLERPQSHGGRPGGSAARYTVITISTDVLVAGNIKFTPIPSAPARSGGLGSYDRIALQLPGNPAGLARDDVVIEQSNSTRAAMLFANIGGSSLCMVDVAGQFGAIYRHRPDGGIPRSIS